MGCNLVGDGKMREGNLGHGFDEFRKGVMGRPGMEGCGFVCHASENRMWVCGLLSCGSTGKFRHADCSTFFFLVLGHDLITMLFYICVLYAW